MKKLIILVLLPLFFIACKKETPNTVALNTDYFAFGHYYGFCSNNCVDMYLIKDTLLYADDMPKYEQPLVFKNTVLEITKRDVAKKLLDQFPSYFMAHPNAIIGCPDCRDQGAIYIELKQNGTNIHWTIDPDTSGQPQEIRAYIQSLEATTAQLQ